MIFASNPPRTRPKCNLRIQVPASLFLSTIQNQLDNKQDVRGRLVNNHVYLQLPESEQHYWSPELHVTVLEEENGTTVKGIAGPNGKVWATFMVFYGLAIMLFIFGGSLGLSELYLGMSSLWIWSIPASFTLYAFIFVAAKYGQRLGAAQLIQLREFLDETIDIAENQHDGSQLKVNVIGHI